MNISQILKSKILGGLFLMVAENMVTNQEVEKYELSIFSKLKYYNFKNDQII